MKVRSHSLIWFRAISVWVTWIGTKEGWLLTVNRRGSSRDAWAIHDVLFYNIVTSEMFNLHKENATRGFELNTRHITDVLPWRVSWFGFAFMCFLNSSCKPNRSCHSEPECYQSLKCSSLHCCIVAACIKWLQLALEA